MKKLLLSTLVLASAIGASASTTVTVGYFNDTYFYMADGYKTQKDATLGVAIKVPANKFSDYVGAKITGLKVALGDGAQEHEINAFMRIGSLTSENVASTTQPVSFNERTLENVVFDKEWEIPTSLEGDLYFGYYTFSPAGKNIVYCSSNKQQADPDQCFMTEVAADGSEDWFDMQKEINTRFYSNLTICAMVEIEEGVYENVIILEEVFAPAFGILNEAGNAMMFIKNDGGQPVNEIELTYTLGDKSASKTVKMSSPMAPGSRPNRGMALPMHYLGTGRHTIEITKVNGVENGASIGSRTKEVDVVAVPEAVAAKYTHRPLVEYYCTESDYQSGITQDSYVIAGLANHLDRITYLPEHSNDKFGQNPTDITAIIGEQQETLTLTDADRLAIDLYGDINLVKVPSMTVDRAVLANEINFVGRIKSVINAVRYPDLLGAMLNEAIATPSIGEVTVETKYNADARTADITVKGIVEDNILPEGEKAKLALFIVEENVVSDSQEFPDNPEIAEIYPDGKFTHLSVVRNTVTDFNGIEIEPGEFVKTFPAVEIENPRWDVDHMKVIAVLQRPETNDRWHRNVLNTAVKELTENYNQSGIESIETERTADAVIFNLNGVRVNSAAAPGLYLEQRGNHTRKILVK